MQSLHWRCQSRNIPTACPVKLSPSVNSLRMRYGAAAAGRSAGDQYDVVLSSGFLAFANHSGFLQAVEEAGISIAGIMGTSAGALAGSLYAAGYTPKEVAQHLRASPPIQMLKPCWEPWRGGVLSLDSVIRRLAQLLPPTFEELERDFAVGVVTGDGEHVLIDSGPLPEAVAASAAIPFVFSSVDVPGKYSSLRDGGVVDRIGLKAWRDRRRRQSLGCLLSSPAGAGAPRAARPPPCLVHIIERSSPFSGADDAAATGELDVHVVKSPKSGVNFFDLGDFDQQFDSARRRARPMLEQLLVSSGSSGATQAGLVASGGLGGGLSGGGGGGGSGGAATVGGGLASPAPLRAGRVVVAARRSGGAGSGSAVRATPDDVSAGSPGSGGSSSSN